MSMQITITMSEADHALLAEAAARAGTSVDQFLLEKTLSAARRNKVRTDENHDDGPEADDAAIDTAIRAMEAAGEFDGPDIEHGAKEECQAAIDGDLELLATIADALRDPTGPDNLRSRLRRLLNDGKPFDIDDARRRIAAIAAQLVDGGVRKLAVFEHDVIYMHLLIEMIDDHPVDPLDLGRWDEPVAAALDRDCIVWTLTSLAESARERARADAVALWEREG
jgi:hypothetical protein